VLIKRVRIQNFRCLKDVTIPFDGVTTFIGPNGVGKSTVLRALDWFFNGGLLTEDDVLDGASERRIQVEVEFSSLTDADREALGKYAPESRDTVLVWRTWEDGADKMTGKALAFGPFEEIRSLNGAAAKKAAYSGVRVARPELDLPAWTSVGAVEATMSAWEHEHPEDLEESEVSDTHFFGFAGQARMSGLFDYVLVTADLRANEEAQDSRTSLLGRILERTVDRSSADGKLQELSARFQQEQEAIHDEHFGPQLTVLSQQLSEAVEAFTQGRSVRINTVNADPKPQKVQFSVVIRDQLTETRVERQGHGFQRALLIAALKLLAEHRAAAEQQGVLCLAIEEPELFQHPVQARAFASVLRRLAEDAQQQIQVTYATHSPFFIEATHFPQIRRVSRTVTGSIVPTVTISHVTLDHVLQHLDGFVKQDTVRKRMDALCVEKLPEALFADAAILVEGSTDPAVIEGCAERDGAFLSVQGIVVVNGGGKDAILLPHAILTLLGVPCYLVFDGDNGCADRMRRNGKAETDISNEIKKHQTNNRNILRYLKATEEDWPSTGAYSEYAVFEDRLETEIEQGWPAWGSRVQELVSSGTGFLDKNRATYRQATLTAADKEPDVFREIIAAARVLRSSL
jgi:putative ATP-dependent endonuclease of OLD family